MVVEVVVMEEAIIMVTVVVVDVLMEVIVVVNVIAPMVETMSVVLTALVVLGRNVDGSVLAVVMEEVVELAVTVMEVAVVANSPTA